MKTWKIGSVTVSIGLIAAGILLLLNSTGFAAYQAFQYLGPFLIILFGIEIVWSFSRQSEKGLRYSFWGVALLVLMFLISMAQFVSPGGSIWQPRFLSPVQGEVSVGSGIKRVEIRIPEGKVEITGTAARTVSYSGKLFENAATQAKADQVMLAHWKVTESGDTLEIILEQPQQNFSLFHIFRQMQQSPYLNIQIPQALLTTVQTKDSSVSADQMNADLDIKTSNGSIIAENEHGSVKAVTSNGAITLSEIDGSADIHTSNGHLSLTNISGAVSADSSNGSIMGSSRINGNWDISSSNGRITLTIPENTNAKIQAKTSNGSIGGDLPWESGETNRTTTIGTGANAMLLRTSNGGITVKYGS